MNQIRPFAGSVLIAALLVAWRPVDAVESFQIKGLRLGQPASTACGKAQITSKLDDLLTTYKSRAPALVAMETNECNVAADTFGGLEIDDGIDLLFLRGQLIQIKFDLEPMHWLKYAEIYPLLTAMHGEPEVTQGDVFTTHRWRQGTSVLSVARANSSSGIEALEIVLRDETSFQLYEARSDINHKVLRQLDDDAGKSDIRN